MLPEHRKCGVRAEMCGLGAPHGLSTEEGVAYGQKCGIFVGLCVPGVSHVYKQVVDNVRQHIQPGCVGDTVCLSIASLKERLRIHPRQCAAVDGRTKRLSGAGLQKLFFAE
eukprot:gene12696-biopygen4959